MGHVGRVAIILLAIVGKLSKHMEYLTHTRCTSNWVIWDTLAIKLACVLEDLGDWTLGVTWGHKAKDSHLSGMRWWGASGPKGPFMPSCSLGFRLQGLGCLGASRMACQGLLRGLLKASRPPKPFLSSLG